MPEYTRPATWEDVKQLARLLEEAGARYALVGGYALAAHGLVRMTEDVDLLVDPSVENSRRWITALSQLPDAAARELASDPDVFAGQDLQAIRINDAFTVDILPAAAGLRWRALEPDIVVIDLDGTPLHVLSLEGLLKTKDTARPKDQADARVIARALEILRER